MILFRVLQGFTGGVLIPLSFDVILRYLPPSKRAIGMAMFTITATFAPAVGPLLGGWLTDNYGWPFIFYINVIPGILLISAVWFTMEQQSMNLGLLKKGDWWGILTMAIGLAAFEIVLEDGNRKDWFGDPGIVNLALIAAVFIPAFIIIIELRKKEPLVDLRLFGIETLRTLTAIVLVYGSQAITYAVRDRAHLWGLRPTKWLMLSTCADVLFISVLANRGLAMAPLSLLVLVTISSVSVAFWMILNLVKIPIFRVLKLS
jgi:DHA2 family multidrug resistance protein